MSKKVKTATTQATQTQNEEKASMTLAEEKISDAGEAPRAVYKISDDLIGMIRELVQLALLTGTNIVDHLRAVVVEVSETDGRCITVSPEYVQAYNDMILKLNAEAEEKMKEMQERLASEIIVETDTSTN